MIDGALEQQVLDVPQRRRVMDIYHHHQPDHLRGGVEIPKRTNGGLGHDPSFTEPRFALTAPFPALSSTLRRRVPYDTMAMLSPALSGDLDQRVTGAPSIHPADQAHLHETFLALTHRVGRPVCFCRNLTIEDVLRRLEIALLVGEALMAGSIVIFRAEDGEVPQRVQIGLEKRIGLRSILGVNMFDRAVLEIEDARVVAAGCPHPTGHRPAG